MITHSAQTQTLSILIVDDDSRFRGGLRTLLDFYQEQGKSFTIVGEASCTDTALALATQRHPDLILLDLELARGNGMTVLRQLQEQKAAIKPLVLSAHQEDHWIYRAMQAGAAGYVFKTQVARQLWEAITTVIHGDVYLPAEVATGFFRQFQNVQAISSEPAEEEPSCQLSPREEEVLIWLVRGASNEAIAKQLYVSVATVKAHLTNIFQKLHVTSRTQAIVTALKMGLIQP